MHHGGAGRSMTFFMAFHFMSLLPGPDSTGGQKQKKQGNKKQLSTSLHGITSSLISGTSRFIEPVTYPP
jgi:hypothetical protein